MELIILGLAGVASVFGITALSKHQKKENEAHYQLEKVYMQDFVQKVLSNRVIFRKANASAGFLTTNFQATDDGFVLNVTLTKDEIQFHLYSTKKSRKLYYYYVYSRSMQAGQVIKHDREFVSTNESLLRQLEEKIVTHNWEKPISFYAKKTFDFFGEKPKEATSPVFDELQQEINTLEALYVEIKQVSDTLFDIEEKHQLERLMHQDLHRLKQSFLSIQEKTEEDVRMMKESLLLIENQLRSFYIKADMHHKLSFERAAEIIRLRNLDL